MRILEICIRNSATDTLVRPKWVYIGAIWGTYKRNDELGHKNSKILHYIIMLTESELPTRSELRERPF